MKKSAVWLGVAFVLLVIVMVVLSTMNTAAFRVEVCMAYRGQTSCRTAAASTQQQALRAATENACALIASGVTDTIGCENTPPVSVKWLKRN